MKKPAGQSRLPDGQLATPGVDRKIPFVSQIVGLDELTALALLTVAKVFDLNHDGDGIVIVDFKEIDILAFDFAEDAFADDFHTESRFVWQHVGDLEMRPYCVGNQINELVRDFF